MRHQKLQNKNLTEFITGFDSVIYKPDRKNTRTRSKKRQNEMPYKTIFYNLPDIYFEADVDGTITTISPSVTKILGYKREQIIGTKIQHYYSDPLKKNDLFECLKSNQLTFDIELDLAHKNNHLVPLFLTGQWITGDHGLPVKIIGMFRYIRGWEKTKTVIRENEKWFRSIMEASPDPIITYDMEGNALYINPAFTRVFGWTHDEVVGSKIDYVPKVAWSETQTMLEKLKKGEGFFGFKTQRYDKSLNLLDIEMSFGVWQTTNGQPGGSIVILRDITEQNKVQKQLEHAQKLETIGMLAGGIAHDFNNILSGIFGFSQLAKMHITNVPRVEKDLEQIQKAGRKAMELIQQILSFSRQTDHKKQPLIVSVVIKEALKLLRATIPTTIDIKHSVSSRARVMADPSRIHQIIMNLGTNAYHAMREKGGVMNVTIEEVSFPNKEQTPQIGLSPGDYIKLSVSDTGCGMDSYTRNKIFDPFFTTKGRSKGTGLGLAVVKEIIDKYQGAIEVSSVLFKGSTFNVFLPIVEKPFEQHQRVNIKELALSGYETIMVVDDDEDVLKATKNILKEFGYIVHAFSNGESALAAYRNDPFAIDIIVTDMNMPGLNGLEFSKKLFEIRPDQPIILCTGFSETISREKALSMGICEYVEKPMITWEITRVIRSILDEKK